MTWLVLAITVACASPRAVRSWWRARRRRRFRREFILPIEEFARGR